MQVDSPYYVYSLRTAIGTEMELIINQPEQHQTPCCAFRRMSSIHNPHCLLDPSHRSIPITGPGTHAFGRSHNLVWDGCALSSPRVIYLRGFAVSLINQLMHFDLAEFLGFDYPNWYRRKDR
jgi:hypothetical protein